jgi:PAS domain S-box-containing protein
MHRESRTPDDSARALSQAQLATIVALVAEAIIAVDDRQRIVFFNEGAERIFGYAGADMIGQPLDMLLPAHARGVHAQHVRDFAAAPEHARLMGERMSISAVREDGEEFPAEASIAKMPGADGMVFLVVLRDVTEQAAARAELVEHQRQLEQAQEQALQLAAEQAARAAAEAAERRMAFLAEASVQLTSSLDPSATLGTIARLAVPAIADWAAVDIVTGTGEFQRLAAEHTDPERVGLVREIERRYPPPPDAPYGVRSVVRTGESVFLPHITAEMMDASAQDAEHARMVRRLGIRSYICVPLAGRAGALGAITIACAESGRVYTPQDLLLAEDLGRRAAAAMENATLVEQLQRAHERLRQQARELEAQADVLAARNVALEEQAAELERLDRTRADFMATISHELRTPLNAIIGYSDLLAHGVPVVVPDAARKHVARIRLGADHLLRLIEEILTFSSLDAGRQKVIPEDVDTYGMFDELQAVIEPLAHQRGLDFRIDFGDMPGSVHTDPNRLRQVLLNLLANAVKFTEAGHITLAAALDGDDIVFSVQDTGIGIHPEDEDRLFEPFWQADQSHTRRVEGAGLGLAIADRLTTLLGGAISFTSRAGEGTEFRVRVPVRYSPPADAAEGSG